VWQEVVMMKKYAFFPLALVAAAIFPVLIFVGAGLALYQNEWRLRRQIKEFVCSMDTDCPPGYVCVAGRCVPAE